MCTIYMYHHLHVVRGDSVISTFHVPPTARGQGQCDIDSSWARKNQQNNQK